MRKVYSSYAFLEDELEKVISNREFYNELKAKYKIHRNDTRYNLKDKEDCDFSEYDIVIGRKAGYNHALYHIYKNAPNLSLDELALICDNGNLCFGYMMEGENIYVFED